MFETGLLTVATREIRMRLPEPCTAPLARDAPAARVSGRSVPWGARARAVGRSPLTAENGAFGRETRIRLFPPRFPAVRVATVAIRPAHPPLRAVVGLTLVGMKPLKVTVILRRAFAPAGRVCFPRPAGAPAPFTIDVAHRSLRCLLTAAARRRNPPSQESHAAADRKPSVS